MRPLLIITGLLLFVILGLTALQVGHPALDPHDQLAFERQWKARAAEIRETNTPTLPELDCAATHLSRESVLTLYVVWINNRTDLRTGDDRGAAAADLQAAITACHASPQTVEDEAHKNGQELEVAAVSSLLKAGRRL